MAECLVTGGCFTQNDTDILVKSESTAVGTRGPGNMNVCNTKKKTHKEGASNEWHAVSGGMAKEDSSDPCSNLQQQCVGLWG